MLWLLVVAFNLSWGCQALTIKIYATVEQVCIKTQVLNLVNLTHTYFQVIYTVYFLDRKKKKITIFHLQLILPQKLWPISGLEAIYRWKTPFPRSLLSILSFFCKGTFAKYTFGNLCTESLSLSSRVTEVTSEVFKIKLEVWLHGYSYWGGEQVKSRNEIYPEKETVLLDFALKHLY